MKTPDLSKVTASDKGRRIRKIENILKSFATELRNNISFVFIKILLLDKISSTYSNIEFSNKFENCENFCES